MRWKIAGISTLGLIIIGSAVYFYLLSDPSAVVEYNGNVVQSSQQVETQISESLALPSTSGQWMSITLILMSIATTISASISFYLYRWRRVFFNRPELLVPEEWGKYLDGLGKHTKTLTAAIENNMRLIGQETAHNSGQITNMIETFMTLQNAIDERDKEIKRLKSGYDTDVFRKFLSRFIRVDQLAADYLHTEENSLEELQQVKRLLEDALDECGVESFYPEVGDDSRKVEGITDSPKVQKADNPEDDFLIVEILEPGYRLHGGEESIVLIPAKVMISMFER